MIEDWLTSGCDERIELNKETGVNKYHLNPLKYEGLLMRGSCTCGTLTPDGYKTAKRFEKEYPHSDHHKWIENQTKRLKNLFSNGESDDFSVFYGPSGTDLMYWALLFQSILKPNQKIYNIVTCPEELGSGSVLAAEGKFYASKNQFGDTTPINTPISSNLAFEVYHLPAREADGSVANRKNRLRNLIRQHLGMPLVINLVFGSKSGIKDDLEIIDEFPNQMWVVDLCQLRVNRDLIQELLAKGVILMLTGSKFYQAPPYCGAILVPNKWTNQLINKPVQHLKNFGEIFSEKDLPNELSTTFKGLWPSKDNVGLRLRWEIALDEMEAYLSIPFETSEKMIEKWWTLVSNKLKDSPFFQIMPDTEFTNNSIISFSVISKGKELNYTELKQLFEKLITEPHSGFQDHNKVFIGQPVKYSNRSFIRVALGSYTIRALLDIKENVFQNDLRLIELIEDKTKELFG